MTAALCATQAGAAVIDFEGAVAAGQVWYDPLPYTEAGFRLAANALDSSAIFGAGAPHANPNGGAFYGFCSYDLNCSRGKDVYVTLRTSDAGAFSLHSVDAANLDLSGRVGTVELVGHLSTGGTVLATIAAGDWASYQLTGFSGLRSVDFYGHGITALAIDNLVVEAAAVPEPGTIALSLLGLAGLAGAARAGRRRAGKLNG